MRTECPPREGKPTQSSLCLQEHTVLWLDHKADLFALLEMLQGRTADHQLALLPLYQVLHEIAEEHAPADARRPRVQQSVRPFPAQPRIDRADRQGAFGTSDATIRDPIDDVAGWNLQGHEPLARQIVPQPATNQIRGADEVGHKGAAGDVVDLV